MCCRAQLIASRRVLPRASLFLKGCCNAEVKSGLLRLGSKTPGRGLVVWSHVERGPGAAEGVVTWALRRGKSDLRYSYSRERLKGRRWIDNSGDRPVYWSMQQRHLFGRGSARQGACEIPDSKTL